MIEVLDKLLKLKLPVDEYAGDTTVNVGQIQGGHAPNVIADHAEAQVLIRLVTTRRRCGRRFWRRPRGWRKWPFTLDRLCAAAGG
jgi:acetylornithine deacetylase